MMTMMLPRRLSTTRTLRYLSTSSSQRVETTIDSNGIAHVQLARPDKLNSLDLNMFEAIAKTAADLKTKRNVRAVILSGQGRAFCTGLDVKAMAKESPLKTIERLLERPAGEIGNLAQNVGYLWRDLPVPVIASLHGMCFGGGLQIALGADFRFSTPDCKLSVMETKWGLIPDMSASITLRELVRADVAKELTMTGRIVTGTEAAELGLVTRCCEDPMAEAERIALEIVQRSPDATAKAKELFQKTWVAPEEYCLKVETDLQRQLLVSWNQLAASGRNFGVSIPYFQRKDDDIGSRKE